MSEASITSMWLSGEHQNFYLPYGSASLLVPNIAFWVFDNWMNSRPWTLASYGEYLSAHATETLPRNALKDSSLWTEHFYEIDISASGALRFRYRRAEQSPEGSWGRWSVRLKANSRRALYGVAIKETENYQRLIDARFRRDGWPDNVYSPSDALTADLRDLRECHAIESRSGVAASASAQDYHARHICSPGCTLPKAVD